MKILLSFFIVLSNVGFATDLLSLRMYVRHTYTDLSTACKSVNPGGEFMFSAEHTNGKISRVLLSNYPYVFPHTNYYKSVQLSEKEMDQIELHQDSKGKYWLKKLPLPEHLLRWVLYWSSQSSGVCELPQTLQTVTPTLVTYEFETESLEEGFLMSHAQKAYLTGTRNDGQVFQAIMELVQKEYK